MHTPPLVVLELDPCFDDVGGFDGAEVLPRTEGPRSILQIEDHVFDAFFIGGEPRIGATPLDGRVAVGMLRLNGAILAHAHLAAIVAIIGTKGRICLQGGAAKAFCVVAAFGQQDRICRNIGPFAVVGNTPKGILFNKDQLCIVRRQRVGTREARQLLVHGLQNLMFFNGGSKVVPSDRLFCQS